MVIGAAVWSSLFVTLPRFVYKTLLARPSLSHLNHHLLRFASSLPSSSPLYLCLARWIKPYWTPQDHDVKTRHSTFIHLYVVGNSSTLTHAP